MLYLDSILFTMLRNCGFEKLREALCFDMAESTSSHRHLSLRKEPAARPPIERRERVERRGAVCRNSIRHRNWARESLPPGHLLPSAFLSFPRPVAVSGLAVSGVAPKSCEFSPLVSVAGRSTPVRAAARLIASSSAPARFSGCSLFAGQGLLTGKEFTREHVLTRGVATPP